MSLVSDADVEETCFFFNVQLQVDTIKKFRNRSQRREAKAQNKPQVLDTGNLSDNNID